MKNKKSELKIKYANELLRGGIKPYSVVRHSYTMSRLSGNTDLMRVQSNDTNLCPTLDTRCDCLAVVVEIENADKNKK